MNIVELTDKFESLLRSHLPDVKVNIFELEENLIKMDVVSDYYYTESIPERVHLLCDILRDADKEFYNQFVISMCPVDYEMFGTRIEE